MSAEIAATLRAAKQLIVDPVNWGQGFHRNRVNPNSLCAAEAISRAVEWQQYRAARTFLEKSVGELLIRWNDGADHATVMAGFDKAIEEAQHEQ